VGLFEPNAYRFLTILDKLESRVDSVTLKKDYADEVLSVISDSTVPILHGAFVGNFGGSSEDVKRVVGAIKQKYPNAKTVGMVESSRFITSSDMRVGYLQLDEQLGWILAQMVANANK
jgi:hypothetical protein